MDHFGTSMNAYGGDGGGNDGNRRPNFNASAEASSRAQARPLPPVCADVKPRLTKEQHDILERHFQEHHKPSTTTKKGFAETLGVPLDKINNWFQNRRAKVKQDAKKQQMAQNIFATMNLPIQTHYPLGVHEQQSADELFAQNQYAFSQTTSQPGPSAVPHEPEQDVEAFTAQAHTYSPFDHGLHSIQESTQPGSRDGIVHNLAAAGYPVQPFAAAGAFGDSTQFVGLEQSGFSPDFVDGSSFVFSPDFDVSTTFGADFTDFSPLGGQPAAHSTDLSPVQGNHNLVEPTPSEPSTASATQSVPTPQSTTSANLNPVASMYSSWTDDGHSPLSATLTNQSEEFSGGPVRVSQDGHLSVLSPSEPWPTNHAVNLQGHLPQQPCHQHNLSGQTLLSSQPVSESMPPQISEPSSNQVFASPTEAFARRDSSTSALAESMSSVGIKSAAPAASGFKQPSQPSSIAARRQRPRPAALGPAALNHRSVSYSAGMPISPGVSQSWNADHTLRRIRSTGITNGRIQKSNPGSAQRSPLNFTFAEAGFAAAQASGYATISPQEVSSSTASLAPPTPLTPNQMSHFPPWQTSGIKAPIVPSDRNDADALGVSWSSQGVSPAMYTGTFSHVASPPITPLDAAQHGYRSQPSNASIYRDTPPQSAPATQQCFPRSVFAPPAQATAVPYSVDEQAGATGSGAYMRRPSLPEAPPNFQPGSQYSYAVPMVNPETGRLEMVCPVQQPAAFVNDFQKSQAFTLPQHGGRPMTSGAAQPTVAASNFFVHEYVPPQATSQAASPPRPQDPQRKHYIFANAGPGDFRGSAS